MRSAAHLELVRTALGGATLDVTALARERTLPVVSGLAGLVPGGGLQRGSTVAIHGVGATSLALAVAARAVRQGSFLAIVAPSSFSLAACLDFDIPLRRVVQFVLPDDPHHWSQAVAAVIEGFDVVILADRHRAGTSHARQLVARNRERGSLLVRVGGSAWPDAADLRFDVGGASWHGLGAGHGHLRSRRVSVQVTGRRYHGPSRAHDLLLPAVGGGVEVAPEVRPAAERFAGADIDALLDVVDGRAVDGGGVDGRAVDGGGVDGRAVNGRAVDGRVVDGRVVDGRVVDGRVVDGRPAAGPENRSDDALDATA